MKGKIEKKRNEIDLEKRALWIDTVSRFVRMRNTFITMWYRQSSSLIESIESFELTSFTDLRQKNLQNHAFSSITDMHFAASSAKPIFDSALQLTFQDADISARVKLYECSSWNEVQDYSPKNSKFLEIGIMTMPLKTKKRILEKAKEDYANIEPGPPLSRVLDIVRTSIICFSEEDVKTVIDILVFSPHLKVVKLKNRFVKPMYNGYRDILLNVLVHRTAGSDSTDDCGPFICEVQVHHVDIVRKSEELNSYFYYLYFRTFFGDSASDAKKFSDKIKILKKMDQVGDDVTMLEEFIYDYLDGQGRVSKDLGRLRTYFALLYRVEEYPLAESTQIRIINILREKNLQCELSKALSDLSAHLTSLRRYAEAQPYSEEALAICEHENGSVHLETAQRVSSLASMFYCRGILDKALPLYQRAHSIYLHLLGANHPRTIESMKHEVDIYEDLAMWKEAGDVYEALLQVETEECGEDSAEVAHIVTRLAYIDEIEGQFESAIQRHMRAARLREHIFGYVHSSTAESYAGIGDCNEHLGLMGDALEHHRTALHIRNAVAEANGIAQSQNSNQSQNQTQEDVASSCNSVAMLLIEFGNFEEAKQLLERSLNLRLSSSLGADHILVATSQNNLAECLMRLDQNLAYAKELLRCAYSTRYKQYGVRALATRQTLNNQSILAELIQMAALRHNMKTPEASIHSRQSTRGLLAQSEQAGDTKEVQQGGAVGAPYVPPPESITLDIAILPNNDISPLASSRSYTGAYDGFGQELCCSDAGTIETLEKKLQRIQLQQDHHHHHPPQQQQQQHRQQHVLEAEFIEKQMASQDEANIAIGAQASKSLQPSTTEQDSSNLLAQTETSATLDADTENGTEAGGSVSTRGLLGALEVYSGQQLDEVMATAHGLLIEAMSFRDAGEFEIAIHHCSQACAMIINAYGEATQAAAVCLNNLGLVYEDACCFVEAEKTFRRALQAIRLVFKDNIHGVVVVSLLNLGAALRALERFGEALEIYEEAKGLLYVLCERDESVELASVNHAISQCQRRLFRYDDAIKSVRLALSMRLTILGEEHPDFTAALMTLGLTFLDSGEVDKAMPVLKRALEIRESTVGVTHPAFASAANNCAIAYFASQDLAKAGRYLTLSLEVRDRQCGPAATEVEIALRNLATIFTVQDIKDSAAKLLKAADCLHRVHPTFQDEHEAALKQMNIEGRNAADDFTITI